MTLDSYIVKLHVSEVYYPVRSCIKEFCSVIYLMSLTTVVISTYQF